MRGSWPSSSSSPADRGAATDARDEAVRDLCRARDDAARTCSGVAIGWANCSCAVRLHYSGGRNWTQDTGWIASLEWASPRSASWSTTICGDDHLEARLIELDARLVEIAATEPYRERVGGCGASAGSYTLTRS